MCSKHLDTGWKLNCIQDFKCHAPCAPLAAGKPLTNDSFAFNERLQMDAGWLGRNFVDVFFPLVNESFIDLS